MSPLATGDIVTSVASVIMLAVAWRWPLVSRVLFAVLFFAAGIFNATTSFRTPLVYIGGSAPHAYQPMRESSSALYGSFIEDEVMDRLARAAALRLSPMNAA